MKEYRELLVPFLYLLYAGEEKTQGNSIRIRLNAVSDVSVFLLSQHQER